MNISDKVKRKSDGLTGTVEDMITDHITNTAFYIVQFDNGEFDTYARTELTLKQK